MQKQENAKAFEFSPLHEQTVNKVRQKMIDDTLLYELADFFKVFGDSTRIKILYALFISEMCVHDLAALLSMNQSAVSHQLRILKHTGLVGYRKEGKMVYYSLKDEHVKQIFDQTLVHISEG